MIFNSKLSPKLMSIGSLPFLPLGLSHYAPTGAEGFIFTNDYEVETNDSFAVEERRFLREE